MLAAVGTFPEHELEIVTGKRQRAGHRLVRQRPVAVEIVEIISAVLQKHAQRLALGFPDQCGIDVSAADIHETADLAQHAAELVRSFPGRRERTDAARGDAAQGAARPASPAPPARPAPAARENVLMRFAVAPERYLGMSLNLDGFLGLARLFFFIRPMLVFARSGCVSENFTNARPPFFPENETLQKKRYFFQ